MILKENKIFRKMFIVTEYAALNGLCGLLEGVATVYAKTHLTAYLNRKYGLLLINVSLIIICLQCVNSRCYYNGASTFENLSLGFPIRTYQNKSAQL